MIVHGPSSQWRDVMDRVKACVFVSENDASVEEYVHDSMIAHIPVAIELVMLSPRPIIQDIFRS